MDLLTAARFEAIGIAAVTNALIACWDAKYTYMFWRPVTTIRAGDTDGNSETEPDPAWTPFIVTPSHPEYPAAHTTVGASVLGFYTVWDTDQFPLAFKLRLAHKVEPEPSPALRPPEIRKCVRLTSFRL